MRLASDWLLVSSPYLQYEDDAAELRRKADCLRYVLTDYDINASV